MIRTTLPLRPPLGGAEPPLRIFCLSACLLALWGCGGGQPHVDPVQRAFDAAVERAAATSEADVAHELLKPGAAQGPDYVAGGRIRALSVMSAETQRRFYLPGSDGQIPEMLGGQPFVLWVTLEPELRRFCAGPGHEPAAQGLRIRQYLGMRPPTAGAEDVLVSLWVSPEDLLRPCPDPLADQCAPGAPVAQAPGLPDYPAFFAGLRHNGYPWTGLGYTFDWGQPRWPPATVKAPIPQGATEFLLRPGAAYTVRAVAGPDGYCDPRRPEGTE